MCIDAFSSSFFKSQDCDCIVLCHRVEVFLNHLLNFSTPLIHVGDIGSYCAKSHNLDRLISLLL